MRSYPNSFHGFIARLKDETGIPFAPTGPDGGWGTGQSGTRYAIRREVGTRYITGNGMILWVSEPNRSGWQAARDALLQVELGLLPGEQRATSRQINYARVLAKELYWDLLPEVEHLSRKAASDLITDLLASKRESMTNAAQAPKTHVVLAGTDVFVNTRRISYVAAPEAGQGFASAVAAALEQGHHVTFAERTGKLETARGFYDTQGQRHFTL